MASPFPRRGRTTSRWPRSTTARTSTRTATPDYGSCIAKKVGGQSYWWLIDFLAPLIQSKGTGQGAFFDTTTMEPLFNNAAAKLALQNYKKTGDFGPPDENNTDLGVIRSLFTTGRCALTLDWGDTGTLAPGTYVADKYASMVLPGSTQVLDQASGALVPCDATTCPDAVEGVNHAPLAAFGGWSGAVNAAAAPVVKDAAYAFLSYMTAPAQSNVDVTIGASGYNPYRTSQFTDIQPWLDAGLSETAANNYLGAIKDSLNSPNMVLDLRIPQTAAVRAGRSRPGGRGLPRGRRQRGGDDAADHRQLERDHRQGNRRSRRTAGGLQRQPHRQPITPDRWIPADRT